MAEIERPLGRALVVAHRGASGYRPEHTLLSYALAIKLGADFIEPDLVSTSDGVLVARHESNIAETTDVAEHPEFAERHATKEIDGQQVSGWFTEDFTLAELKTLRAKERLPGLRQQNTLFDRRCSIPTLQEIIDLVRQQEQVQGRTIGLYPETKTPSYFRGIGLPVEETLAALLHANGYQGAEAPIFIQSFEVGNLKLLRGMTDLPLAQVIDDHGSPPDLVAAGDRRSYADLITPEGLAEIAGYAQAILVNKHLILPRDEEERLGEPTALVRDAHAAGLPVHAWTFRNENAYLPAEFRRGDPLAGSYAGHYGDAIAECELFLRLGVDGLFSDNPDTALAARDGLNC